MHRCGLGVRETLESIFKLPSGRTLCRHRRKIKRNLSSVPDNCMVKQDIQKVYHRKLTRRKKGHLKRCQGSSSIASILSKYIKKRNEEEEANNSLVAV